MTLVRWKRFTWNLEKTPPRGEASLPSFLIKGASREDERVTADVILNALALDYGWGDVLRGFRASIESQLGPAFHLQPVPAIVVRHGQRIIAASLLTTEPDAETHLLSGPCVLSEYRNRGIGSALLLESLHFLHNAGLTTASGITRESSTAEKFVYRKFGSVSAACEYEPEVLVHR